MFGKVEELMIVLIIILVLFGGKKLPELSKSVGQSIKELRKGLATTPATQKNLQKNKHY